MVPTDKLAGLAVVVVVDRSASIIIILVQFAWQYHGIADTRQDDLGTVSTDGTLHLDRTILIDSINLA